MTVAEALGWAQSLLDDLGLLGFITAFGVVFVAVSMFRLLFDR